MMRNQAAPPVRHAFKNTGLVVLVYRV